MADGGLLLNHFLDSVNSIPALGDASVGGFRSSSPQPPETVPGSPAAQPPSTAGGHPTQLGHFCRWDPESETGSHREGLLQLNRPFTVATTREKAAGWLFHPVQPRCP